MKSFTIQKDNPRSRHYVISQISGLDSAVSWDVEIRRHKAKRNLPQNAKFHALVSEIARHIDGVNQVMLKHVIKDLFFSAEITVNGQPHRVHKDTHKASAEEMSDLIQQVEAWAVDELGLKLLEHRNYDAA